MTLGNAEAQRVDQTLLKSDFLAEKSCSKPGSDVVFLKSGSILDLEYPIFPCVPVSKNPYKGTRGFKDATTDLQQILCWWSKWPDALIGMPTGSKSGYLVLDVDDRPGTGKDKPKDGSGSLAELEKGHSTLPDTWEVITPSGGRHFWFMKTDIEVRNSQSRIGDGLDIRGEGGYVIIPPSKDYHWEISNPNKPAEMPIWLIELARKKKEKSSKNKQKSLSIKRKGKSYFNRLPVTQKFYDFPTGKYEAEFIGWTVLEPKAFILKDDEARIEMRFKVYAGNRYFYISSYHLVSILKAPKMLGQIQTGRGSDLAYNLNNIIGGIDDDGLPIVIDLNDVDFDIFMDRRLTVTVCMTKKAKPPYAYITHMSPCCCS